MGKRAVGTIGKGEIEYATWSSGKKKKELSLALHRVAYAGSDALFKYINVFSILTI